MRSFFFLMFCSCLWFDVHAQVSFTSSNLPIIVINTNGQVIPDETKITADMGIIYKGVGERHNLTDPFNNYNGKIGIELRGSSSQQFPKKQYGIELRDGTGADIAAPLMGFPAEEDWVLFAPYNDKSLMRDVLAYKLSRSINQYAPRTKYCELVLNGEYQGVYVLIERIKRDKNRVAVKKLEPFEVSGESLTGGYIIKLDKKTGSGGDGWFSQHLPVNRSANQSIFFQYEYPKPADLVWQQKQYISNFVLEFENALAGKNFASTTTGYRKYIDVQSFVDFMIINEISKNVDGYRLSTFLHKQNDAAGGKLRMGPVWDFNLGFGNANYCTGSKDSDFVFSEFNNVCGNHDQLVPFWWTRLLEDEHFDTALRARWNALRKEALKTETIHAYIDSVAAVLSIEARQRNFEKWPVIGVWVWPNSFVGTSYEAEVKELKEWIAKRTAWLDKQWPAPPILDVVDEYTLDIGVVPNPFDDALVIKSLRGVPFYDGLRVTLFDQLGRRVFVRKLTNAVEDATQHRLDVSHLSSGMYWLTITTETRVIFSQRVLKR